MEPLKLRHKQLLLCCGQVARGFPDERNGAELADAVRGCTETINNLAGPFYLVECQIHLHNCVNHVLWALQESRPAFAMYTANVFHTLYTGQNPASLAPAARSALELLKFREALEAE